MTELSLSIAGVEVRLREQAERPLSFWPAQAYAKFETPFHGAAGLDFEVEVVGALPSAKLGAVLFDGGDGHWKLHDAGAEGLVLEVGDASGTRPRNRAFLSRDLSRGRILTAQGAAWSPSFVINPVVEICLLTRLSRSGALMLHAAGVDLRGAGLIFAGPSGAGKSTLSGLFVDHQGALILNDERVVIREAAGAPVVHGTPWCGSNPEINAAHAPLRALWFIGHGAENRVRPLSRVQASALCVKQAILPYWDPEAMAGVLAAADGLFSRVEPRAYDFRNDPSAVEHLLGEAVPAPAL